MGVRSGLDDAAIVLIHRLPHPHPLDLRLRDHELVRGRRPSFDLRLQDRVLISEIVGELSGAGARERYLRVAQESQLICEIQIQIQNKRSVPSASRRRTRAVYARSRRSAALRPTGGGRTCDAHSADDAEIFAERVGWLSRRIYLGYLGGAIARSPALLRFGQIAEGEDIVAPPHRQVRLKPLGQRLHLPSARCM